MKSKKISLFDVFKKHVSENNHRGLKIWLTIIVGLFLLLFYCLKIASHYPIEEDLEYRPGFFGVTYSTKFSDELGLNQKETYLAVLDDLKVKNIRIPVYWDEIEKNEGVYDFSNYDYLLNEGEKRNVKFIMSLGRRVPRWPECHSPAWLNRKSDMEARVLTLNMLKAAVNHYKNRPNIEYWQIENEPFLGTFGVCPAFDQNFLEQEVELVRSLDSRKIIITASGELGTWRKEAKIGDIFGSTLYRVVYNSWFGFIRYPLPTAYYKLKAKWAGLPAEKLMVLELQAEPWVPEGRMIYLTEKEINKSMSIDQFKANLQYAINLNFNRTYIWGVEWWYFQKKYGNPAYWQIAERLFN